MKRMFTAFVLSLVIAGISSADEAAQTFEQANQLYLQAKYPDAIAQYEKIVQSGFESGEFYFNLGNAYYKSGNIQKAILNYERAKQLLPRDEDVQFNLQLANLQVVDKIDAVPRLFVYRWIDSMLALFSLSTMGWIVYSFFPSDPRGVCNFSFRKNIYPKKTFNVCGARFFDGAHSDDGRVRRTIIQRSEYRVCDRHERCGKHQSCARQ